MNDRRFGAFAWIFFFYLLQNALGALFPSVPFPFLVSAVIYFALTKGPGFGAMMGFWAGLLLEAFASGRFGVQIGLWTAAGFVPGLLSSKVFPDSLPVRLLLPLFVQAALLSLEFALRAPVAFWEKSCWQHAFFWQSIFMTFATTPLVFGLLRPRVRRNRA